MSYDPTTQPATHVAATHTDRLLDALRRGVAEADLLAQCRHTHAAVAVLLVLGGVVFLLWGFYAFKGLVLMNAALVGAWAGYLIGQRNDVALPGALVGAFLAAAVTWPLMKYAVAVMGGLIGAMIGMTLWRALGLDPAFAASGGGMGLIFFGMLSFILFRTSVMMFTSLQGAVMLAFGLLCLVYKLKCFDHQVIDAKLQVTPLVLPMVVGLAALAGLIYQNGDTSAQPVKAE